MLTNCHSFVRITSVVGNAGVAQLVEQLICNQQVGGSSPSTSSIELNMGDFPSGQRGQTVNLLSTTSVVRIHHPPPKRDVSKDASLFSFAEQTVRTGFESRLLEMCLWHISTGVAFPQKSESTIPHQKIIALCSAVIFFIFMSKVSLRETLDGLRPRGRSPERDVSKDASLFFLRGL